MSLFGRALQVAVGVVVSVLLRIVPFNRVHETVIVVVVVIVAAVVVARNKAVSLLGGVRTKQSENKSTNARNNDGVHLAGS